MSSLVKRFPLRHSDRTKGRLEESERRKWSLSIGSFSTPQGIFSSCTIESPMGFHSCRNLIDDLCGTEDQIRRREKQKRGRERMSHLAVLLHLVGPVASSILTLFSTETEGSILLAALEVFRFEVLVELAWEEAVVSGGDRLWFFSREFSFSRKAILACRKAIWEVYWLSAPPTGFGSGGAWSVLERMRDVGRQCTMKASVIKTSWKPQKRSLTEYWCFEVCLWSSTYLDLLLLSGSSSVELEPRANGERFVPNRRWRSNSSSILKMSRKSIVEMSWCEGLDIQGDALMVGWIQGNPIKTLA